MISIRSVMHARPELSTVVEYLGLRHLAMDVEQIGGVDFHAPYSYVRAKCLRDEYLSTWFPLTLEGREAADNEWKERWPIGEVAVFIHSSPDKPVTCLWCLSAKY
jgi:hypothetical protein